MVDSQSPPISDTVRAFVARVFPEDERASVEELLFSYGVEPYEREVERIRMDIVSISEGRTEKVAELVRLAKYDYRDLIVAAEYEVKAGKLVRRPGMPLVES